MSTLAKAILVGVVFVVALLAVLCGLRRVRRPSPSGGRGVIRVLRTAFYASVAAIVGASPACSSDDDDPEATCYLPSRDDGLVLPDDAADDAGLDDGVSCYVPFDDAGEVDAYAPDVDADIDADVPDDGPRDDVPWVECYVAPMDDGGPGYDVEPDVDEDVPDAGSDVEDVDADLEEADVAEPDGGGADAYVGLAPRERTRRERWVRRTVARVRAVRGLLDDSRTDPVVREVLRRELSDLRRQVVRVRRWVRRGVVPGSTPSA